MGTSLRIEDILCRSINNTFIIELKREQELLKKFMCRGLRWSPVDSDDDEDEEEDADVSKCSLCEMTVLSDEDMMKYNGAVYTTVTRTLPKWINPQQGFLRCVYCFGIFHRHRCMLKLSDHSYYYYKHSKDWACPNCVPEFVMTSADVQDVDKFVTINVSVKSLFQFVKAVYDHINMFGICYFSVHDMKQIFSCVYDFLNFVLTFFDIG